MTEADRRRKRRRPASITISGGIRTIPTKLFFLFDAGILRSRAFILLHVVFLHAVLSRRTHAIHARAARAHTRRPGRRLFISSGLVALRSGGV